MSIDLEKLKHNLSNLLFEIAEFDFSMHMPDKNGGLHFGSSGLSLFFYHLYLYTDDDQYLEKSRLLFEDAFQNINPANLNFSHGASGIMWLLNYYSQHAVFEEDYEDYLSSYDNTLFERLDEYKNDIDPMHGLLGMSSYLLSRNNQIADKCIERIVDIIDDFKIQHKEGILWHGSQYGEYDRNNTYFSFGYAHGIPAILYFLSRFISRNIKIKTTTYLFNEGMSSLLSQQEKNYPNYFPGVISKEFGFQRTSKIAYCYGDLGIACGLTSIGSMLDNKEIISVACKIAEHSARISISEIESVKDIGLCHGATGNGYMFYKLYKTHKSDILEEASLSHYQKLLSLKEEGTGVAGYCSIDYDSEKGVFYRKTDPGFINGTAGAGLSIISFLSDNKIQGWEDILYLR